jgi:uncharacterized membrane protein
MEGTGLSMLNTYGLFLAFLTFFVALFFSRSNWPPGVTPAFKIFTLILILSATAVGAVTIYLLNGDVHLSSTGLPGLSVVAVLQGVVVVTLLGAWLVAIVAWKYK